MKESSIHALIKGGFPNECLLDRIENTAGSGMADCACAYKGVDFWLEYKMINAKSAKTTIKIETELGTVYLRPEQYAWHMRRQRAGSRTFVLARDDSNLVALWLNNSYGWEMQYFPKPFNYKSLLQLLLHGI